MAVTYRFPKTRDLSAPARMLRLLSVLEQRPKMYKKITPSAALVTSALFFTATHTIAATAEPPKKLETTVVAAVGKDASNLPETDGHDHEGLEERETVASKAPAEDGGSHANETPDAHAEDASDTHTDEAPDAHANEAPDAHAGEESGGDLVRLTPEIVAESGIVVEQAKVATLGESLSLPAEIRFDTSRVANVSPRVSGIVDRLFVTEGDTVAYGDTLALITSRELASLKARWLTAEARKSLAQQALTRAESLWSQKIASEANVQTARAEFETAKAESDAAETELHAVGIDHSALAEINKAEDGNNADAFLRAPLAGTVVRRAVTLGETVTAGDANAKILFSIVDDGIVWADIIVYKQDISRVRVGAHVALKSDTGEIIAQSKVAFVLPVIDEVSRTATARVIVDNSEGTLTPGQFVIADLSVGTSTEVLRVPQSAVQLVENNPAVFVPVDGGFAPRPVMVGTTAGGYVEIKAGLEEGDLFVSDGAFTLKAQLEKDAFGDGHGH